ncbi:hypothetical protein WJX73_010075 [Symbiochloris irregularis]|uniref:MYB transcription factor n=1 Tax=Symbiochloris irregularis TaxID=706552 RepID=A0AAW1PSZ9_9CHLO
MPRQGAPKQKWTPEEEQALRAGVARYGVGKWRLIQKDEEFTETLCNRSNVDLKDKWRNLNMEAGTSRGDRRTARSSEVRRESHRRKRKRRPERASEAVDPTPNGLHALHAAAMQPSGGGMTTRRRTHGYGTRRSEPADEDPDIDDVDEDPEDLEDPEDEDDEPTAVPLHEDIIVTAIIALRSPLGSHADDIVRWVEAHYGSAMQLRTSMKATLRNMVEAGRLERVPEQQNLYRLGGIMRQFEQDPDHAEARPARRAKRRSDPQAQLQAAEVAAAAVREAEEAAAAACRLEAIAEAMLERSHSLPLEAMSGHQPREDSPATRMPLAVPLSHSTPDLNPLGGLAGLGQQLDENFGRLAKANMMHSGALHIFREPITTEGFCFACHAS